MNLENLVVGGMFYGCGGGGSAETARVLFEQVRRAGRTPEMLRPEACPAAGCFITVYGVGSSAAPGGAGLPVELHAGCRPDGMLVLVVADRGSGVPDVLKETIFERYERGREHVASIRGLGLGLSIVRRIVEQHQGQIHVRDRAGGGSEFVVQLPVVVSTVPLSGPRLLPAPLMQEVPARQPDRTG